MTPRSEPSPDRGGEPDRSGSVLSSVTDTVTISDAARRAMAAADSAAVGQAPVAADAAGSSAQRSHRGEAGASGEVSAALAPGNGRRSEAASPAVDATVAANPAGGTERPGAQGARGSEAELTVEEQEKGAELESRDAEVRTHEQAHVAVGGQPAGAPRHEFEAGPDGRRYAVEGKVSINVSAVEGDPKATVEKMRAVHAAALAPTQPSAQDRAVAARAAQVQSQAQAEVAAQHREDSGAEPRSAVAGGGDVHSVAASEAPGASPDPVLGSAAGRRAYSRMMIGHDSPSKGDTLSLAA